LDGQLGVPLPQALLAYAQSLGGRFEGVLLVGDQADRILLELRGEYSPLLPSC
jgi:hypothetical protein